MMIRRRHRPWIRALTGLVLATGGSQLRAAVPPCFNVVTPAPDAVGVPLDTRIVFEVTETDVQPHPQLFAVEAGKELALVLEDAKHSGPPAWRTPPPPGWTGPAHTSGVYSFKPREELKPRTRYEIRCWKAYACGKGNCPVSFTTGVARARPSVKPSPK
jgi:hypothetical protein